MPRSPAVLISRPARVCGGRRWISIRLSCSGAASACGGGSRSKAGWCLATFPAIQVVHRIGALLVFGHVSAVIARAARRRETRAFALAIGALLLLQVALGIGNVLLALPLPVATAHNGVAALLLFALLALLVRTRREEGRRRVGRATL